MKKTKTRVLAVLLCIALCMNLCITAFAANETNSKGVTFTLELSEESLSPGVEHTVTATLKMSQAAAIVDMEYTISCDNSFTVGTPTTPGGTPSYNPTSKKMMWMNTDDVTTDTLGSFEITIPADTMFGEYPISVNAIALSSNAEAYWEDGATATAMLTILEPGMGSGPDEGAYNASISVPNSTVTVEDLVYVNINVTSDGTHSDFNSCEIDVNYNNVLTFEEGSSTLGDASISVSNGTVSIVDKGESKGLGNGVYTLAFSAENPGDATISLGYAAFGTDEDAETQNLTKAEYSTTPVNVTVKKVAHAVQLPDIFAGNETVEDGGNYTFSFETVTGAFYEYSNVKATVNGVEVPVSDNKDGTWTISGVTGPVVITADRTPKKFDVTINGDTASNDGNKATYNTPYVFTLPEGKEAGLEAGYSYALTSITINGNAFTEFEKNGLTYTIPGEHITGDVVITITKTDIAPNTFTVDVDGSGAGAAVGTYPATVALGGSHTLTLSPEAGYNYSVSAEGYSINKDGNNYTISNITGNVVFVITREVSVAGAMADEYVKLNGTTMWLIQVDTTLADGKTYTYKGNNMFWSSEYNAYCVLEVSSTKPVPASADFNIISGTAVAVDYTGDVNMTGKIDANDAQLVYNIYNVNVQYTGFTTNVTMEKFLRADTNGSGKVDVADARKIIDTIFA